MIHLIDISKHYGPQVLYKNGRIQIETGDKIGLVGPNGAGKTTIFKVITGEEHLDGGSINVSDKTIIGYFSQDVGEMSGCTVLEEVKKGAGRISELAKKLEEYDLQLQKSAEEPMSEDDMANLLEKYGEVQSEFEQRGGYALEANIKEILAGLGFEQADCNRPVESFSGGWKMRIALAKILALNPDVLLMDEPTNHLDIESIVWLEGWLIKYKGALMMTSHDRTFMNRIVKQIVEVANKTITTYGGNYDFYERERDIRREQLLSAYERQQDMLAKEQEFISRFAARASHAAQVQSRVKMLEKIERIEIPSDPKPIKFEFGEIPRSGQDVVKIENLSKEYIRDDGSVKKVFSGATAFVNRLQKIAVTGVNGAGKSTMLKIITGQTEPTTGNATIGASVKIGYFSQHSLDVLNPNKTIYDEVQDRIPHASIGYVRNLLAAFSFTQDDVYKKISILSGGEKSRVVLATMLASPVNFLVLDEPTNHLDIKSREVLLDALERFDGTIMLVSHDRYFLNHITNRVFEVDHGALHIYEGKYEEYLERSPHGKTLKR